MLLLDVRPPPPEVHKGSGAIDASGAGHQEAWVKILSKRLE